VPDPGQRNPCFCLKNNNSHRTDSGEVSSTKKFTWTTMMTSAPRGPRWTDILGLQCRKKTPIAWPTNTGSSLLWDCGTKGRVTMESTYSAVQFLGSITEDSNRYNVIKLCDGKIHMCHEKRSVQSGRYLPGMNPFPTQWEPETDEQYGDEIHRGNHCDVYPIKDIWRNQKRYCQISNRAFDGDRGTSWVWQSRQLRHTITNRQGPKT
jgi:hypothetical protein